MDWLRKFDSTLLPALLSSVLCWLAFPPVGWSWLAWIGPVGWLACVARDELPGRRPYRALWLAGLVFWMLTLHWIRLPHAMNYLGWPVLCGYLAVYLPLFVTLARVGVHRLRLPMWLVAPVVWTGLDWVRGNLFTGFLMGSLAHTQVANLPLIQISNLLGEYGVTFLIVMVPASLTQCVMSFESRPGHVRLESRFSLDLLVPAVICAIVAVVYGCMMFMKQNSFLPAMHEQPGPRVALIQGNTLPDWKGDPDRQQKIMLEYARLSEKAVAASKKKDGRGVDLIIWPETSYRYPLFTVADGYQPPDDRFPASNLDAAQRDLAEFVERMESAILTGIDRVRLFPDAEGKPEWDQFNSSVMIDKSGELVGTYDKMHLVIMGEYVPFTRWLPFLKKLTPMTGLASPGERPAAFTADGVTFCPNICYETCVPHLIRRQVKTLADAGTPPDVLVNLTNDAWFWGSSELDMHLACGIFRAVEMRRPLLVAANGGLSAFVDAFGNVRQITPRQETAFLLVDLWKQRHPAGLTVYARHGDWFAILCAAGCAALAIVGWRTRGVNNGSP